MRRKAPSEDDGTSGERQLHLAENLYKALAFVLTEISAILRFIWRSPHHFDAFIHWLDQLDPSRALASWGFAPVQTFNGRERRLQGKGRLLAADDRPSDTWTDVHRDGRHAASSKRIGVVEIEVLQAGGWTRAMMGDAFSAEDVFVMVVCDGCVGVTCTKDDCVAPAWGSQERRAFRLPVYDAAATLSLACFNERTKEDWPIGRCAVALRSFAPNTVYDCWLPLVLADTAGEKLANQARALVASAPLATQASMHQTQAESRGSIHVRFKVDWTDGGVSACRSALADVLYAPVRAPVATPATLSGQRVRENVRFALFGEGGCPSDALNEPFATQKIRGHAREAVADVLNAVASAHAALLALIRYERPLRSLLALCAWASCVRRPVRSIAWVGVFSGLALRDALVGDAQAPAVARPSLSFGRWFRALIGLVPRLPVKRDDEKTRRAYARGVARKVVSKRILNELRQHHADEAEEEAEEKRLEEDAKGLERERPMKAFWSFNPLAPLLLPIQRFLLSIARRQRALKAVCSGRDDPVATATLALACFLGALGLFVYTELVHPWVVWILIQAETVLIYALHAVGLLVLGPQNYVLSRLRRRLRRRRHVKLAMTSVPASGSAMAWRTRLEPVGAAHTPSPRPFTCAGGSRAPGRRPRAACSGSGARAK